MNTISLSNKVLSGRLQIISTEQRVPSFLGPYGLQMVYLAG